MIVEDRIELLEEILGQWKRTIGNDYPGYRNHVYRMIHFCFALRPCGDEDRRKIIIAACFHDMGIWANGTVDYLPPSIALAKEYLKDNDLEQWTEEIELMIDQHHKFRKVCDERFPLVEVFRQGDLVDFSLGVAKFGLGRLFVRNVKNRFPNAGFHKKLMRLAGGWFLKHPLTPPPFMKW